MSDDYSADRFTTGTVAVGGSTTGTIEAAYDQDWFAVELVAGHTYQFDLRGSPGGGGTLPDTYFRAIYNSDGRYQSGTFNDNFDGSRDSRVTFTPTDSGTYYARVSGDRNETGDYTLTVTDMTPPESVYVPDSQGETVPPEPETAQSQIDPANVQENVSEPDGQDLPADTTTTGRIAVGGSVTGMIERIVNVHHEGASETDWFAVELVAGTTYRMDLKGSTTGHGTLYDPYLYGIFDSDGNRIPNTANDDSYSPSRNSWVEFTPEEDGTYFIAAGAYAGEAKNTGTYTLTVIVPDDDYSAGMDTEGAVAVGGKATGEIETKRDQDWFAVTLEAGTTYRVVIDRSPDHDGPLYEPHLVGIYDSNGTGISSKTISSTNFAVWSRYVEITPETAGTYYIAVDGQLPFGKYVGKYTVSVKAPDDDYSADTDTEGTVVAGGTARGEIEVTGDQDWFAVDLVAGAKYRVELMTQNQFGTVFDTYLAGVYDSEGILILGTKEGSNGIGNHAPLTFSPTETGTHYIAAADASSRGVGKYTLAVTEIPDDYAAHPDPDTTGTVAVGGSVEGEIETPGDRDWFAVELEAGKAYRFNLKGSPTNDGTLADPYLRGIHDADGERIAHTANDDGGKGDNSRVTFTADTDGTYYVAAGASRNGVGTYTLKVAELPDDYAAHPDTTGTVAVGGAATEGAIDYRGDVDWFAVELDADSIYRIHLKGLAGPDGLRDPTLAGIYDGDGRGIEYLWNEIGGGSDNRLLFRPNADGTYYVAAEAWWVRHKGSYEVSVTDVTDNYPQDLAAGPGTTGTVAVAGSTTGKIDYRGDRDWFEVTLDANRTYQFDLEDSHTGDRPLNDPFLRGIYDSDGRRLAKTTNDDGGEGYNSRVTFTADEAGTYYVAAGAYGYGKGTYTLSVDEVVDAI